MSLPTQPLLKPKPPVASAFPPSMQGQGGRNDPPKHKSGVLLNFLTAYLDSGFAFQIALYVLVFWARQRPLDSYQAEKSYGIVLGACLLFYFVVIPIGLRATLGRVLLKKYLLLTFILGTAFLVFTSPPLTRDLEEIFYASPAVIAGKKIMDERYGPKKAEPFFVYFTPEDARLLFWLDNRPIALPLIFDGNEWKFENNPQ